MVGALHLRRGQEARGLWSPLASGSLALSSLRAARGIAAALPDVGRGERDWSLAAGDAGLALLYAWLARADVPGDLSGRRDEDEAWSLIEGSVEALATQAMDASLYSGVTGIAWAVDLVDGLLDPDGEDRNDDLDEVLLELARGPRLSTGSYDLVRGVVGIGVYALRRHRRPAAAECLVQVVDRLAERAHRDEHGAFWWTAPEDMPDPEAAERYPAGCVDLGVAHGVAGVIALLGGICQASVAQAEAAALLREAVRWLRAQAVPARQGETFPVWVAPGLEPEPARRAWCYGDPGIAAALLSAARGLGDAGLAREAEALACRAATSAPETTGVVDASFCHGTAGLAHIYNRLHQATGNPDLATAARYWLERTLDFHHRAVGELDGAHWVEGTEHPRRGPWTGLDIVDGAVGVALVLLAAATPVEPDWDGMFLLSPGVIPPPTPPVGS